MEIERRKNKYAYSLSLCACALMKAEAEGSPRLMPTSVQQRQITTLEERMPRELLTCTA